MGATYHVQPCLLALLVGTLVDNDVTDGAPAKDHMEPDMFVHINLPHTNATYVAYKLTNGSSPFGTYNSTVSDDYDSTGAMYFAVAVILIYGISIAMLVATTLRHSDLDDEMKGFLRTYAMIDSDRKSKEKQRIHKSLQERNLLFLLPGVHLAHNSHGRRPYQRPYNPTPLDVDFDCSHQANGIAFTSQCNELTPIGEATPAGRSMWTPGGKCMKTTAPAGEGAAPLAEIHEIATLLDGDELLVGEDEVFDEMSGEALPCSPNHVTSTSSYENAA